MSTPDVPEWAHHNWGKVVVDQHKVDLLDKLYEWDGRDDPQHPYHHTYTGLYQKYTAY